MKFSYKWLQTYFETPLPEAEELERIIGLQAFEPEGLEKVDNDVVLDFDILPNRAHDCLCHLGLAKEISALCNVPLAIQSSNIDISSDEIIPGEIKDPARCQRYMTRVIKNVSVGPSPEWLKKRLESIGQRSINNIVDATNYVMFDLGQPLHAFDAEKTKGPIVVECAQAGESITLLGGETKELSPNHLVIRDQEGVLAIAGVKGGSKAEVTKNTTDIILEAANFEPVSTRKTSRELKLQTDSSKRFENEISPEKANLALDAVSKLILDIASTKDTIAGPAYDTRAGQATTQRTVTVRPSHINKTLGTNLSTKDIAAICSKIELVTISSDEDTLVLSIPYDRLDLEIPEDIIEEVGRMYGYDKIPSVLPSNPEVVIHGRTLLEQQIRSLLLAEGWNEVMTYTFTDSGDTEMLNALASDKNFLRTNLQKGFADSLEKNIKNVDLFGTDSVAQFEIGSVFSKGEQATHLILGYASTKKKDTRDLGAVIGSINTSLGLNLKGKPTEDALEVELPKEYQASATYQEAGLTNSTDTRTFEEPSVYPFITRDVSVWIPEATPKEDLVSIFVEQSGTLLVTTPRLFDEFSKEGRTSYAYRLVFQALDRTLTDNEIAEIMQKISHEIESRGWEER